MSYTSRLRRGLTKRIETLARELASAKTSAGLFPDLEHRCSEYTYHRHRLDQFSSSLDSIRQHYAASQASDRLSARQD